MRRVWAVCLSFARRPSIRRRIAVIFSVTFFLLFAAQMLVFSQFLSDIVSARANDYILETLRQTQGKVDACIDKVNVLSKSIVSNSEIRGVVQRNLADDTEISYSDTEKVKSELSNLTLAYDGINSVQIFTSAFTISYNFFSSAEDYEKVLSLTEENRLGASGGELVLLAARQEYVDKITNKTIYVFSAVRKFFDIRNGHELGYVFVNINENVLRDIIGPVRIGTSGHIQVFNREGIIVSSEQPGAIGTPADLDLRERLERNELEGFYITPEREVVVYCMSGQTGWGTVVCLPMTEVTSEYGELQRINFAIGVLGVLVAVLISVLVSGALTRPIKELLYTMQRIQEGDLSAKVKVKSQDEIGRLGQVFNQMTTEMHTLIEQYYEGRLSKKESELKAMQAQISPHFLYNSLDSVYWMLVVKGEEEIADMLVALCEVLRYSISRESGMVSLNRELEMIRQYMAIQKGRFGAKLIWKEEVEQALRTLTVPKMVLQPLVENAIVHGMDSQKSALCITIKAIEEGGHLVLYVIDDGMGMEPGRLTHTIESGDDEAQSHTGLGLITVNQRIQILFGEEYGLSLSSEPGAGTTVRLSLPLIHRGESGLV